MGELEQSGAGGFDVCPSALAPDGCLENTSHVPWTAESIWGEAQILHSKKISQLYATSLC